MSGDGLPTGTFHDRMALFKGKEKATGNKPPVLTPKPAGERHTPSTLKVIIILVFSDAISDMNTISID